MRGRDRRANLCPWLLLLSLLAACGPRSLVLSKYGGYGGVRRNADGFLAVRAHRHRGVDFKAKDGVVRAVADGRVAIAVIDPVVGGTVIVRHQGWYLSVYMHLEEMAVEAGEDVHRGERIGTVGLTPASGGVVHLHFELCTDFPCVPPQDGGLDGTVDPLKYLDGCEAEARGMAEHLLPVLCE